MLLHTLAAFSSRGPTKDGRIKPDLLAPGVNINSLSHVKIDGYHALSGTSMATPLVSGSAALILNKEKDLSPLDVKEILMDSSVDLKLKGTETKVLNLKKIFQEEPGKLNAANYTKQPAFDNIFMILVILFLLDSRF